MEKLENLKRELKLKLSEHMMFNNTLAEMIEKDSSTTAIEEMEDEIKALEKDIRRLQEMIRINRPKEETKEGAKKSFYNEIKKPKLAKTIRIKKKNGETFETEQEVSDKVTSFYDAIEKNDFAPYDTPYNKLNEKGNDLKYKEMYEKVSSFIKDKKFPLIDAFDGAMDTNRFLVRFEGNVNVPEWYVRRVSFSPSDRKEIYVQIFDFLTEDGRPIITEFNGQNMPFRISIDHLDPTSCVLYTERYHGCNVMEIIRGDLAYNLDEKATMELRITYSDVSYETNH